MRGHSTYAVLLGAHSWQLFLPPTHGPEGSARQTRRKLPMPTSSKPAGHCEMHTPSCRYWLFLHLTQLWVGDGGKASLLSVSSLTGVARSSQPIVKQQFERAIKVEVPRTHEG